MVIYQYNNTAWVSMRSRLWKCASEQLRPATGPEARGAELLSDPGVSELVRQVQSGTQRAGVDVAREGPPPPEAWEAPVEPSTQDSSVRLPIMPSIRQLPPTAAPGHLAGPGIQPGAVQQPRDGVHYTTGRGPGCSIGGRSRFRESRVHGGPGPRVQG
eukprot:9474089-Pyramimonas_sp.AAC.1